MDATLAFGRADGAAVIAEGVENEFVADLMKAAGVRFGQGFGLGLPTSATEVEDVGAALAGRAALSGLRPRSPYFSEWSLAPRDQVPNGLASHPSVGFTPP